MGYLNAKITENEEHYNNTENTDEAKDKLTKIIKAWLEPDTKTIKLNHPNHRILPQHIRELIKEKVSSIKKAYVTQNPRDKATANRLNTEIKEQLKRCQQEQRNNTINQANSNIQLAGKIVKSLRKVNTEKQPLVAPNGITRIEKKAETFASSIENHFTVNSIADN